MQVVYFPVGVPCKLAFDFPPVGIGCVDSFFFAQLARAYRYAFAFVAQQWHKIQFSWA
jgi:hypothetical protein